MLNHQAPPARWLVRLHFGQTAIPARYFETYPRARRYAGTLRRASVRLILTEREHAGLCALVLVGVLYAFNAALGA